MYEHSKIIHNGVIQYHSMNTARSTAIVISNLRIFTNTVRSAMMLSHNSTNTVSLIIVLLNSYMSMNTVGSSAAAIQYYDYDHIIPRRYFINSTNPVRLLPIVLSNNSTNTVRSLTFLS